MGSSYRVIDTKKMKYGVDIKHSKLPLQKETYLLHFPPLEISHPTWKAVCNKSFVVNVLLELNNSVHITEEGRYYKYSFNNLKRTGGDILKLYYTSQNNNNRFKILSFKVKNLLY